MNKLTAEAERPLVDTTGGYSVLMSVYVNDRAPWLMQALESMANQSVKPREIVLVLDGPLTADLNTAIEEFEQSYPGLLTCVPLASNVGLGPALNEGLTCCNADIVVRMDSDDIAHPKRCELQLERIKAGYDMVGSNVSEFSDDPCSPNAMRVMPKSHEEILTFAKKRAPFVHPTFTVRKQALEEVGGYRSVPYAEDFDLFIRLLKAGYRGCNVQADLLNVRVDDGAYKRRGGISYMSDMISFNWLQLKEGWFGISDFLVRTAANVGVALVPNGVRDAIYKRLLRKRC